MNKSVEVALFNLKKDLGIYVKDYCFTGLKGGTETEDMDYDELLSLLGRDLVPVVVKIGGPEARTDIRFCRGNGIDGISAPMIESQYALKNFIATLKNLIPPVQYDKLIKSMNLETITGYRNILEIADSKAFEELDNVTAARSDLSSSMDMSPDDPEVMRVTTQIIKIAKREKNLRWRNHYESKFFHDCRNCQTRPDQLSSRSSKCKRRFG